MSWPGLDLYFEKRRLGCLIIQDEYIIRLHYVSSSAACVELEVLRDVCADIVDVLKCQSIKDQVLSRSKIGAVSCTKHELDGLDILNTRYSTFQAGADTPLVTHIHRKNETIYNRSSKLSYLTSCHATLPLDVRTNYPTRRFKVTFRDPTRQLHGVSVWQGYGRALYKIAARPQWEDDRQDCVISLQQLRADTALEFQLEFSSSRTKAKSAEHLDSRSFEPSSEEVTVPALGKHSSRFDIHEQIHSSDAGSIFRADDRDLGIPVAIKVITGATTSDGEEKKRFRKRMEKLVGIQHRNIVHTLFYGQTITGHAFMVMEYIVAQTLQEMIKAHNISTAEAVKIAVQVADGLGALHAAGLIHRDVKPSNILIDRKGVTRLCDLELVVFPESQHVTATAGVGTIKYMSPEQVTGGTIDYKSDIWSLGVVLYKMVAGHDPFQWDTPEIMRASISEDEPRKLDQFNVADDNLRILLQSIIDKALTKKPSERFKSAVAFAAELRKLPL